MTTEKPYVKALDAMRAIAISAVVLIHTTTRIVETTNKNLGAIPWTFFLNQATRFAVPLFFMISGFSLELNYPFHTSYFSFLKKRLGKIFIPYLFWSAIYYFFIYTQNHDNFAKVLYMGNASYQLYFIPSLFIFYILFPLIHNLYDFLTNKWVLLVLAYSQMYILHYDYFVKTGRLDDPLRTVFMCYFVFILGMVAARNKDVVFEFAKKVKYYLAGLSAMFGFYVFWEGMVNFTKTGNYTTFYSNYRPSTLVYSVLFGLLLFYIFDREHLKVSPRKKLSDLSFFIFFIHVIVLENVWKYFGSGLFNTFGGTFYGKIIFDPLFFITVLGISFLIAFVIRKIPYASKITG